MSFLSLCSNKVVSNSLLRYADKRSVESGISGYELVKNAAEIVVDTILEKFPARFRVSVLCGPGNNGGDGYFIAQLLRDKKFRVNVFAPDQSSECSAHSLHAAQDYAGTIKPLSQFEPEKDTLVIDALFGSGIKRPIEDMYADVIKKLNDGKKAGVISVDIPSGICAETGAIMGIAVQAAITVCFERLRPGHVLFPGHAHCGAVTVKKIGINDIFLEASDKGEQEIELNSQNIYMQQIPKPNPYLHKYTRGYVNIVGGDLTSIGAARLCSRGAAKTGVGIIRMGVPQHVLSVVAGFENAHVPYVLEDKSHFIKELEHPHLGCVVIGPGSGLNRRAEILLDVILERASKDPDFRAVLDADIITLLAKRDKKDYQLTPNILLTPHEGEFKRLFPELAGHDKMTQACMAAKDIGATVLLKGPDTLIATPDGRCVIQTRPLFNLATAGSGDILCGIVAGLIARKMPVFEAACAAIALHADAAEEAALYSTADELAEYVKMPLLKYDFCGH